MQGERATDHDVHRLVATLHLAEHLMRRSEGLEPDADWSRHGRRSLDWLGARQDDLQDWEDDLQAVFDAA